MHRNLNRTSRLLYIIGSTGLVKRHDLLTINWLLGVRQTYFHKPNQNLSECDTRWGIWTCCGKSVGENLFVNDFGVDIKGPHLS